MNPFLFGFIVVVTLALSIVTWIIGLMLARRAFNRWRWPEARLIFRVHIAQLVLFVASAVALPLVG